jgi:hypothetical protein
MSAGVKQIANALVRPRQTCGIPVLEAVRGHPPSREV